MGIFGLEREVHPWQFHIFLLTLYEALWLHHEAFSFNTAGSKTNYYIYKKVTFSICQNCRCEENIFSPNSKVTHFKSAGDPGGEGESRKLVC